MTAVAVIDLDGCLCRLNTFRVWLVFSSIISLLSFRWMMLLGVILACFNRLAGRIDRIEMKRRVMLHTQGSPACVFDMFFELIRRFTRQAVVEEMMELRSRDARIVLNTAAPACYADRYAAAFGFDAVIASSDVSASDEWIENSGEEKLANLDKLFRDEYNLICVVTDHEDDLPLMRVSENVTLVCPQESTLLVIPDSIEYRILR